MYFYQKRGTHCIETLLLLWRWDTGEVRDSFGGMGRFKAGLNGKGWVDSVTINVITEITYRCNYMHVFKKKCNYNVKKNMYSISALY